MAELWGLRGLSWRELAKRTCRKSWDDEVFGQAAKAGVLLLPQHVSCPVVAAYCAR